MPGAVKNAGKRALLKIRELVQDSRCWVEVDLHLKGVWFGIRDCVMYRTQGNMFLLHSIYVVVVENSLSEFGCYGSGFCLLIHGDSFRGELSVVYFPRLLISCWLGVLNDPRRSFCPSKTRLHDEDGAVSEGNGACAADREENSLGWLPSIYGSCCPTVARPVGKLNKTTRLHPPLWVSGGTKKFWD